MAQKDSSPSNIWLASTRARESGQTSTARLGAMFGFFTIKKAPTAITVGAFLGLPTGLVAHPGHEPAIAHLGAALVTNAVVEEIKAPPIGRIDRKLEQERIVEQQS